MPKLILLRHGECQCNLENRFSGNVDIALTKQVREEMMTDAQLLKYMRIDLAYTSVLQRAVDTLNILPPEMDLHIPIMKSAPLSERNYGQFHGLTKAETAIKYGFKQVLLWRRSFLERPPGGETLKDTFDRVISYYQNEILTKLWGGRIILTLAHGNSLTALVMYLENLNEMEFAELNFQTCIPRIYDFCQEKK